MGNLPSREHLEKQIREYKEILEKLHRQQEQSEQEQQEQFEYLDEHYPNEYEDTINKLDNLELKLREIDYSDEKVFRHREFNKLNYVEGHVIRDSESKDDFLSRTQYAQELSKLISNKKTLSPLTLGIYGPWGEGKSSFLELIKIELEKINLNIREDKIVKNKYNKTHVVRFDASEYNDQNKIWFSLLSQIFAKYEKEGGILAKIKFSFGMVKKSFKDNLLKYVINFTLLGLFIAWVLIYSKDKSLVEVVTKNPLYTNIFGLVSTMAVTFNIVKPMFKKIKSLTKPMSVKIISQFKYPKYRELLGTREKVKESLEVLIDVWTKKNNDKIVIMVDELDRCSEKTIVEFFEALQLFLPIKSIVHVISINEEAVCFALANNNQHFFEEEIVSNSKKLSFGKKYLEKYITIPYHLPYENNYKNYIKNLLVNESDNTDLDVFNEKEKSLLTKFIIEREKQKHITPREIKKIINLLLLSKERIVNIYKAEEIDTPLKFEEYMSWFLLKYFFPDIAEKIIDYLARVYKHNKYKTFDMIESQLSVSQDFKELVDFEKAKDLFKYLKGIRIEYIIRSNNISEHLILKKGI